MPHALTERQKEYLQYLRDYIQVNETTPRLEEVADHFDVSLPTAHKILDALEKKGYLFSRRERESGYYIRLAERGGGIEKLIGVFIVSASLLLSCDNLMPGQNFLQLKIQNNLVTDISQSMKISADNYGQTETENQDVKKSQTKPSKSKKYTNWGFCWAQQGFDPISIY